MLTIAPRLRSGDDRQLGAHAVEDGVLVDLDDTPPRVKRILPDRRGRAGDARIVDGDAQRAKLASRGHGTLRELRLGDIAHQAGGGSARGADLVHDGLHAHFVDVGDQNCGTVGGEQARDRPSDP